MGALRLLVVPVFAAALAGCACNHPDRGPQAGPGPWSHRGPDAVALRIEQDGGRGPGPGPADKERFGRNRKEMKLESGMPHPGAAGPDAAHMKEMHAHLQRVMERVERLEAALKGREMGRGPGPGPGPGPGHGPKEMADAPQQERMRRAMEEMKAGLAKREARIHELENVVEKLEQSIRKMRQAEEPKEPREKREDKR